MPPKFIRTAVLTSLAGLVLGAPAAHATKGFSVIYTFCPGGEPCTDGIGPYAGLTADQSGNFYGTAVFGGTGTGCDNEGCGTLFELTPAGSQTTLYSFCQQANCWDGANPIGVPLKDSSGNLFGTTEAGGSHAQGTVFEVSASGTESVLYSFCGQANCADGEGPYAGVVMDAQGDFYGTTQNGGTNNCGVVFKLASNGSESVLHSFGSYSGDGCMILSGVIRDTAGNLFGSAAHGGGSDDGAIFEITSSGTEKLLYSFCLKKNCVDGEGPSSLIEDADGDLYGTTVAGGVHNAGTAFRLSSDGHLKVLYAFCTQQQCTDGGTPFAGLLASGHPTKLYGTTIGGGSSTCPGGCGVVFEISGSNERVLHAFDGQDGYQSYAPVTKSRGWLFGTSWPGTVNACCAGTVFKLGTKGDGLQ